MRPAQSSLLVVLSVLALYTTPAASQFAVSTNPIPHAALDLMYKADRNQWLFVDKYAVPYERMLVQLCVGRNASACSLASVHASGLCESLGEQLAGPGWRAVDAPADPCLGLARVNASMRSDPPNGLALDNNFSALRAFDLSQANNQSDGSIVLRVRFVYVQSLGTSSAHVHSSGYELVMRPLQDTPESVVVQTECSARGLRAPHSHLAPALGGSILEVVVLNNSGTPTRVCMWQCALPYLKMPWNAPPLVVNVSASPGASAAFTASCARAPASFAAVALTIPLLGVDLFSFDVAAEILLGVDRLAELMAADLLARFGPVRVLISLRDSEYNTRRVQEVLDWIRSFQRLPEYNVVATVNTAFDLKNAATANRRLLQASNESGAHTAMLDVVLVAGINTQTLCCLADSALEFPQKLKSHDLGTQTAHFEQSQVEVTVVVKQKMREQPITQDQTSRRKNHDISSILVPILIVVLLVGVFICLQKKRS